MNLRLTVYLMDGTRDYVEVWLEIGTMSDFMYSFRRFGGFIAGDTWYPLHGILKLRAGWDDPQAEMTRMTETGGQWPE